MKKLLLMLVIAAMAMAPLASAGSQEADGGEDYDTLHIYTSFDTEEAQYYVEAFEEATGIDVDMVRLSAGEALARIEAEGSNPQGSVWFGGSNTSHINAADKGLLQPYKPNIDFELPENFHADDNSWNGFYTGAIGFVTNTNFLEEHGLEAPNSWEDLMHPAYENNIEMAYPYTSGTAYTTWATRIQMLGLEDALDWWEEFDNQIHQYTKSGSASIARAGLGECAVGIGFSHDILAKGINQGYPLVLSFPEEGTGYEVGGISMINGAKEVKEAEIFIDWAYSVEAQNMFQKYSRLPVNPEATVAEGAVKMEDIELIDYDAVKHGLNKEENVKAWRDRLGK